MPQPVTQLVVKIKSKAELIVFSYDYFLFVMICHVMLSFYIISDQSPIIFSCSPDPILEQLLHEQRGNLKYAADIFINFTSFLRIRYCFYICFSAYQKTSLEKLEVITREQREIKSLLSRLLSQPVQQQHTEILPTIFSSIPLKEEKDIRQIEKDLGDKFQYQQLVITSTTPWPCTYIR